MQIRAGQQVRIRTWFTSSRMIRRLFLLLQLGLALLRCTLQGAVPGGTGGAY